MRKILIFLVVLCLSGCNPFGQRETTVVETKEINSTNYEINKNGSDFGYIKAVHYFGSEWPINFWSSELYDVEKDMKQIKEDGFNSIVLVIPWGEFQPKLEPIKYNTEVISKLQYLIEEAEKKGLNVLLRLGYAWDFDPEVQMPNIERLRALYTDPKVYNAWLSYLEKINQVTTEYQNVLFGFLTWEDFWNVVEEASNLDTLEERIAISNSLNFSSFLKGKYSLEELSEIYGQEIHSWEEVPVPEREKEAFELYYQFIDELLVEKFYKPAQNKFPKLSMEVRVDSDPVYLAGNEIEWYSHKATFDLPNSEYITTYYSPAMGALNEGDETSASEALKRQEILFADIKSFSNNKKIFVDQFLYTDNTPEFARNTKVKRDELDDFIRGASEILGKYTNGYGLWVYKDYAANMLYNSQFEVGMKGWEVNRGDVEILEINGDNALVLKNQGSITQFFVKEGDFYRKFSKTIKIWFNANAIDNPTNLTIKIGSITYNKKINITNKMYKIEIPIEQIDNYNLSFEVEDGTVAIDDIKLFSFVQEANIYTLTGEKGKLLKSIQDLNKKLPEYN